MFLFKLNLFNLRVSERFDSSLHILVNSLLLIVITEEYSVSGIPNYSLSSYNRFKLKSENFSPFWLSKTNLILEGSSSADSEMESSDPAHLRIFDKFSIERPRVKGRSHLKDENPDSCKKKETSAT